VVATDASFRRARVRRLARAIEPRERIGEPYEERHAVVERARSLEEPPTTAFGADARVLPVPAVVTALDERRAGGWPLAALLLSTTLGAKRKSATID